MIVEEVKKSILQDAILGNLSKFQQNDSIIDNYLYNIKNNIKKSKEVNNNFIFNVKVKNNWKVVKLGEICEIYGGKRIPAGRKLTNINTGYPYIRVADMDNMTIDVENILYVPVDIYPSINKYIISKNDLYITVAGTIGRIGFIPEILDKANLTENANKIVFNNINKKWLYYTLISPFIQKQINEFTTKVGQPKLAIKRIVNLEIPIPCLEEQERIVRKIEELFYRLDDIKSIEEELLYLKNKFPSEFKKSLMQYAISGKLTMQSKKESIEEILVKIEEINKITNNIVGPFEIPANWRWIRFGELVEFNIGKTPPRANLEYWNGKYPWVSISDMNENDVIIKTKEFISDKAFENIFKKKISKKGTLLMSFKLTVGRCSILDIDAFHNEGIISIYPKIDSYDFKKYLFKILPYITKYGDTKGAIKGNTLNSKSLKELLIPVPPLGEQQRIVEKLELLLPLCDDIQNLIKN